MTLGRLLAACAIDASRRGEPDHAVVCWLFGADPQTPLRVLTATPQGAPSPSPDDVRDVLCMAASRCAATLGEFPTTVVVLRPAAAGIRLLEAVSWGDDHAVVTPYLPGAPGASLVRRVPLDASVAVAILLAMSRARQAVLN